MLWNKLFGTWDYCSFFAKEVIGTDFGFKGNQLYFPSELCSLSPFPCYLDTSPGIKIAGQLYESTHEEAALSLNLALFSYHSLRLMLRFLVIFSALFVATSSLQCYYDSMFRFKLKTSVIQRWAVAICPAIIHPALRSLQNVISRLFWVI